MNNQPTPEDIRRMQQPQGPTKEEIKRVEDCMEAVKAIVGEYKVQLIPIITLGPGGVLSATIQGHAIPEDRRIIVPTIKADEIAKKVAGDKGGA